MLGPATRSSGPRFAGRAGGSATRALLITDLWNGSIGTNMLKMLERAMRKTSRAFCICRYVATAVVAGFLQASPALAAWNLNMPVGVSDLSRDIHQLHMLILWICVVIAVLVFGAMIYSIVKFRRSAGAEPATFVHNTQAEIIWTIIPIVILVGMAIPAAETLVKIEDTRDSNLTIKVTGYQWKWHYDYLDDGVKFFSALAPASNVARQLDSGIDPDSVENYLLEVDNPLVVPVNAKVRILLTAADVTTCLVGA